MHELSIAQSIIAIAEKTLSGKTGHDIKAVRLQVGELSGIETESLLFSFSVIRVNTLLHNASLDIEVIEGQAQCNRCTTSFHLDNYGKPCPNCGSYDMQILKGKEMKVLNILVDNNE